MPDHTPEQPSDTKLDMSGFGCAAMILAAAVFCNMPAILALLHEYLKVKP